MLIRHSPSPPLRHSGRAGAHFCASNWWGTRVPGLEQEAEDSLAPDFKQGQAWEMLHAETSAPTTLGGLQLALPPTAQTLTGPDHTDSFCSLVSMVTKKHLAAAAPEVSLSGARLALIPTGSPGGLGLASGPPGVCVGGAG